MRRFQEEKESQLSSVSDRINDILNLLVENSASAIPASANGFKTEPLKSSLYSQSASANGFKSEPLKSTGYKREASTDAVNGDYQRGSVLNPFAEADWLYREDLRGSLLNPFAEADWLYREDLRGSVLNPFAEAGIAEAEFSTRRLRMSLMRSLTEDNWDSFSSWNLLISSLMVTTLACKVLSLTANL